MTEMSTDKLWGKKTGVKVPPSKRPLSSLYVRCDSLECVGQCVEVGCNTYHLIPDSLTGMCTCEVYLVQPYLELSDMIIDSGTVSWIRSCS